ncbi:MAG TPA: rhodanese-like domain-containing protein [Pseudolysinimonas sp.]|nr:rhodanese-like domain-containing protein [Pseudolysinimonas sp.]
MTTTDTTPANAIACVFDTAADSVDSAQPISAETSDRAPAPLVSPAFAAAAVAGGALLVDVRSDGYRERTGGLPQAVVADRDKLAEQFGSDSAGLLPGVSGLDQPIVVICGSVNGSTPVTEGLLDLGFRHVIHVEGGYPAWKDAGLPTTPGTEDGA